MRAPSPSSRSAMPDDPRFIPYEPAQTLMFPSSMRECLPEGHLAFFIEDVVERLDLRGVECTYSPEGRRAYHPRLLTKVLLYGYCTGTFSSRRLEEKLVTDIAYRVLAAGQQPDFRTISDFRKRHLATLQGLFVETVRMCRRLGMVKLGRVAVDGTKVKANASRHKAMSYERMVQEDARLRAEIAALLRRAQEVDEAEDRLYGKDSPGEQIPQELRRREDRLVKIEAARRALEEEARAEAKAKGKPPEEAKVPPKKQRGFTDRDARMMKTREGFVYAFNGQVAVDEASQVIVAQELSNEAPDVGRLLPVVDQVKHNMGKRPKSVLADAGYASGGNFEGLKRRGIEGYVALGREAGGTKKRPPPGWARMARRLRSAKGREEYRWRKAIVEPVFGFLKAVRGFRQFLLRGLERVRGEWALLCATHNLRRIFAVRGAEAMARV